MIYTTFSPIGSAFKCFLKKAWVLKVIFDDVFLKWSKTTTFSEASSPPPPPPTSHLLSQMVDSCLNFLQFAKSGKILTSWPQSLPSDPSEQRGGG